MTGAGYRFASGSAAELIRSVEAATEAALLPDPSRLDRAVDALAALPFSEVATALAVVISRRISLHPAALLLSTQADLAPATTLLSRTAGQVFILAASMLASGESPAIALAALSELVDVEGPVPVVKGGMWALVVAARVSGDTAELPVQGD